MKFISLMTMLFTLMAPTSAHAVMLEGEFTNTVPIYVMFYNEKASCEANDGEWMEDPGACLTQAENRASVEYTKSGYMFTVTTVGSNAHSCYFQAAAKKTSNNTLTATVPSTNYATGHAVQCVVNLKYTDSNTLIVESNNENCSSFCGANAWLNTDELTRTN